MKKNVPQLDLHPLSSQEAKSALREFLTAALRQGKSQVRIIHGLGAGRMEELTQQIVEEFGYAKEDYHYDGANCGATIVHL
jgi:DNA-nicking Smr family endonuclease